MELQRITIGSIEYLIFEPTKRIGSKVSSCRFCKLPVKNSIKKNHEVECLFGNKSKIEKLRNDAVNAFFLTRHKNGKRNIFRSFLILLQRNKKTEYFKKLSMSYNLDSKHLLIFFVCSLYVNKLLTSKQIELIDIEIWENTFGSQLYDDKELSKRTETLFEINQDKFKERLGVLEKAVIKNAVSDILSDKTKDDTGDKIDKIGALLYLREFDEVKFTNLCKKHIKKVEFILQSENLSLMDLLEIDYYEYSEKMEL